MKRHSTFDWIGLLIGIFLIALGVLAFANPNLILTGLVFLYGIAAVVLGVADLVLYIRVERYTGFGPVLSLISGIVSVMSGIMLLVYPRTGAMVLTLLFPLWFISHCISRLFQLHRIRPIAGRWISVALALNIVGLILGLLMLMSPIFTLSTLRYFSSIYLILLGLDGLLSSITRTGRWL